MSSAKTIRDLNQIYLNEVSADTALSASKAALGSWFKLSGHGCSEPFGVNAIR